jgi:hypothetical protein
MRAWTDFAGSARLQIKRDGEKSLDRHEHDRGQFEKSDGEQTNDP